jgi:hypothetical protein
MKINPFTLWENRRFRKLREKHPKIPLFDPKRKTASAVVLVHMMNDYINLYNENSGWK